ncbi:MAG TPA: aminotransferase class IV [Vicinamibacterales bacterium]|nr:aminotransferase class IV [Vicinamibacterales bacterium]
MRAVVWVNGQISDAASAAIPVFDHGFLYGEGVYETLRTYDQRPAFFERHMQRLRRSAGMMALAVPYDDAGFLARVHETTTALDAPGERYIRILLTRGVGDLTYDPAACPTPSLVIIVKPFAEPPVRSFTEGIAVALVGVRRNHPAALNPRIKSNNLLNNALAMQEALRQGAEEALMLNQAGHVTECSQANFFVVLGDTLVTAPLEAGLLPGITREYVLELAARLGVPAAERDYAPAELASATEAFVTSTTREVMAVTRIDDRIVGDGRPGPITNQLLEAYRAGVN